MQSIKPGRAQSFMGGIGAIIVGIFGVLWTVFAASMGAPWVFTIFGIMFVIIAICISIYSFVNATKRNRYSVIDITEGNEEPDPLNQRFGNTYMPQQPYPQNAANRFCPYCGTPAQTDFEFCNVCGKKLP